MITDLDNIAYKIYTNYEIKKHNKYIELHKKSGCICGLYSIEDFIRLDYSYIIDKEKIYKEAKKKLRLKKILNVK